MRNLKIPKRLFSLLFSVVGVALTLLVANKLQLEEGHTKELVAHTTSIIAILTSVYIGGQSLSDTWGKGKIEAQNEASKEVKKEGEGE